MGNIFEETKFIMKKYNIKANKSLGQNFLISEEVVNAIVDCSEISKDDMVIEIGPGLGTLTKYLLERAAKVLCVELDQNMINILNDRFSIYDNFELLNQDVLKTDLKTIIKNEKSVGNIKNVKVVANLPYYITTPIIMKLLEEQLDLDSITVMIQKEVADRLIEIPGGKDTGAITYTVYYYSEGESIMDVPNNSFVPEPQVTSEVIRLKIRNKPNISVKDEKLLFKIIKCAFTQRRKTLINSLTNTGIFKSKEEGISILRKININDNIRAEKLSLNDFAMLTDEVYNLRK